MKNNRLTNEDIRKLRMACERIRDLASLEKASFTIIKEEDDAIKRRLRPYMMWFESIANGVDSLLDGEDVEYLRFR